MHLKIAVFQFIQPALIFQSVNGEFNAGSAMLDDKPRLDQKTNNLFEGYQLVQINQLPFEKYEIISY